MHLSTISAVGAAFIATVSASPIAIVARQSSCAPLMHINAAGTFESGLGLVGSAMQEYLPPKVPGATVQPLNYNSSPEYVLTPTAGAIQLRKLLTDLAAKCPDSKFSLSGYSKGAIVLHRTDLPADVQAKVVAVAVFGDPNQDTGSQGIPINNQACYFQYCNEKDTFCDGPGLLGPHLTYGSDGSVEDSAGKIANCYEAAL